MRTSNSHIINQMAEDTRLAEALRFYGMGELADATVERVSIEAYVTGMTPATVECLVVSAGNEPKICEFLRSEVTVQDFTAERAMLTIPKAYLPAFCLWRYELTGRRLEEVQRLTARHNAPYLKSTPATSERVGGVRI